MISEWDFVYKVHIYFCLNLGFKRSGISMSVKILYKEQVELQFNTCQNLRKHFFFPIFQKFSQNN